MWLFIEKLCGSKYFLVSGHFYNKCFMWFNACALYLNRLCAVSQHCEVRGCGKFKGWVSISINTKGSFSRSLRDAPSLNHVFIAFICLATASQLFLSHDDQYEYPARF